MIRIVRSHRLEALADALAEALAPQRTALDLAPDTIIVPSTAMARWVEARLAQRKTARIRYSLACLPPTGEAHTDEHQPSATWTWLWLVGSSEWGVSVR